MLTGWVLASQYFIAVQATLQSRNEEETVIVNLQTSAVKLAFPAGSSHKPRKSSHSRSPRRITSTRRLIARQRSSTHDLRASRALNTSNEHSQQCNPSLQRKQLTVPSNREGMEARDVARELPQPRQRSHSRRSSVTSSRPLLGSPLCASFRREDDDRNSTCGIAHIASVTSLRTIDGPAPPYTKPLQEL